MPRTLPSYPCTYLSAYLPIYLPTHQSATYLPIHRPTYLPSYGPTDRPTALPTYLPAYLLTWPPRGEGGEREQKEPRAKDRFPKMDPAKKRPLDRESAATKVQILKMDSPEGGDRGTERAVQHKAGS